MKILSTTLVGALAVAASAAFAADLPAKKSAPAASPAAVSACPAFGAGFLLIPGSETCIKFYGYVRADFGTRTTSSGVNQTHNTNGRAQLAFAVMNNADIGVISSTARINSTATGLEEAYVQAAGLTGGLKYSIMDVSASTPQLSIGNTSYTVNTLLYTMPMGSSSFSLGLESAQGAVAGTYDGYRPDIVGSITTKAANIDVTLNAASTAPRAGATNTGAEGSGYGLSGKASVKAGAATIAVLGAYGYGASRVAGTAITNFDGTNYAKSVLYGARASIPAGEGTLNVYAAEFDSTTAATGVTTATTTFAVNYAYTVSKVLVFTPEISTQTTSSTTTTNGVYLRIQRNF